MASSTWAALFDWDGVIIDSSERHEESWELLAQEEGLVLPADHFIKGFGMKNTFIIPELLQWTQEPQEIRRLSLRKEELYREQVIKNGAEPLPGVVTWLKQLKEAAVPCVIGSSTERLNITTILGQTGLGSYFQGIVSAEDVSVDKPHPEVFIKAAVMADRIPARCVVFEDAFVGIEAARAGGMKVIGVATTHPKEKLGQTDMAVERLDELTIKMVESLWTTF
ncbi:MAG: HAD family phosphatase [Blastochloris sp.]|nr:HAD family phosphatase [Blastochloris sp.]